MTRPSFEKLLTVFRKAGYFPCKKHVNTQGGDKTCLKPVKICNQVTKQVVCGIISVFISFAAYFVPYYNTSSHDNMKDFIHDFYMTGFSLKGSPFDIAVNLSLYPLLIGLHIVMVWKLFKARHMFCEIFNFLEYHCPVEEIPEKDYGGTCRIYDNDNPSDPWHNVKVSFISRSRLHNHRLFMTIFDF